MCQICKGHPNCPVCEPETQCPECKGWGYTYEPLEVDGMDLLEKVDCQNCDGSGYIYND